jgi:prepilin peptidase CpaA
MYLVYCLLSLLLFYAATIDICQRRIPNWLCALITLLGLLVHGLLSSKAGFYASLIGLSAGLLPMLFLSVLTGLGAGDVKLMAAIGSVVGAKSILIIFCYSFLISGAFAIVYLIVNGGGAEMLQRYSRFFTGLFKKRLHFNKPEPHATAAFKLPMAPGIAIATGYVLLPQVIGVAF